MNINDMEIYAREKGVPIIQRDSLSFIESEIKKRNIKNVLEIGTAIGYSAISFSIHTSASVTSIERDVERYNEAVNNVKYNKIENKIKLYLVDALDDNFKLDDKYELIFIDAAKGQNIKFFEKYINNLSTNGIIIIDNINFHGLTSDINSIKSRRLRSLVKKINESIKYFNELEDYKTTKYEIGDGLLLIERK